MSPSSALEREAKAASAPKPAKPKKAKAEEPAPEPELPKKPDLKRFMFSHSTVEGTIAAGPTGQKEEPKPVEKPAESKPIPSSTVETREAPAAPKPADGQKLTVSLVEWEMKPGENYAKPGKITMQIVNRATRAYTITVQDKSKNVIAQSSPIASGTSGTFEFTIASPGAYNLVTEDSLRDLKGLLIVE